MTIQEGLRAQLLASSAITALVGSKVFPVAVPNGPENYPCVTYACVGGSGDLAFDNSGITRQRVELNGHSLDSYAVAANIRVAINAALDGWKQQLADGTSIINTVSLNPGTDFVSEERVFRCMIEFYVDYTLPS